MIRDQIHQILGISGDNVFALGDLPPTLFGLGFVELTLQLQSLLAAIISELGGMSPNCEGKLWTIVVEERHWREQWRFWIGLVNILHKGQTVI